MLEGFTFDYDAFFQELLNASRQGFQVLKERYAGETFYSFGYYSHGSRSFVWAVANTEEELTRVAQFYSREHPELYENVPLADMRTMLRHSISDYLLNQPGLMMPIFDEVCRIAGRRSFELRGIYVQLSEKFGEDKAFEVTQPEDQRFLNTCFAVLKQLESEGMFGLGAQRESVILNYLMGDMSEEEMFEYASLLNSETVVERYKAELEMGYDIYFRLNE